MSKGLRVFGHPLHAILSDLPAALLGTSLLWDGIGILRDESVWWQISFWNIALGLAAALIAATAGAVDYTTIEQGSPALKNATLHMLFMLASVLAYTSSLIARGGPSPTYGAGRIAALALEGIGVILLSIGGWYGGHLVFHYGIGRDEEASREDR